MNRPLRITADREVRIRGFAEKLGLNYNKLSRKERLTLFLTQIHIHDVLNGGKERISAPTEPPSLEDYQKEVKRENPSLAGRELDKQVQEAERQHAELLEVSQIADSVPPVLVDLDKVQAKDTIEAIDTADEKEAPDAVLRAARDIALNPSIGAFEISKAPGSSADEQRSHCWEIIRNFFDSNSQEVTIQGVTEMIVARKLNRSVGWLTADHLQTLQDALGRVPERTQGLQDKKGNITFGDLGIGMGRPTSTPIKKLDMTEANSQFFKGIQSSDDLPDVRLEARPRTNPFKPLIRAIDKIKSDLTDHPDVDATRQIFQFLRKVLRMIELASQQIRRVTQVYPRFLQVPRNQEVLVEYMTDRFLFELLVDTISKLREVMIMDERLNEELTAWILEDGYLTQIVVDNLVDSYPLAQETNFPERTLPPYVTKLNEYYLTRLSQDVRQKYDHLSGEFWQVLNDNLEAPGGVRMYTLRLMTQECLNNQVTEAGHQLMVEPVMTALGQQTATPTAIVQQALRGEKITSEDKYRAILNEAASRKKELEKQKKDRERQEKENLQLLKEDKNDSDMMQNIAEFNDKIKDMRLDEDTKKMVFQGMLFKSVFQPKEQTPPPAPKGSTIQLKELGIHSLKSYSGDQHEYAIKQFLKRMDTMKRLRKWTDEEAVVAMETLSTGAAAEWWDNQRMAGKAFLSSYEQTKIELLLRWYQSTTLGEKSDIRAKLRYQPEKHKSHLDFYDECERKSFLIHDSGLAMEEDMDVPMTRNEFRKQDTLMSFIAGCSKEIKKEIIKADAKTWPAVKEVVTLTESALRGCENEPRPNQRMLPGYNIGAVEVTPKTAKEAVSAIQNKSEMICYHCSKKGHIKRDCFLLKGTQSGSRSDGSKRNYREGLGGAPEASAVRARRGRFTPRPSARRTQGPNKGRKPFRRFRSSKPPAAPKGRVLSVNTAPLQGNPESNPVKTEVHHHYATPEVSAITSSPKKVSTVEAVPVEGATQSWERM